MILPFKTQSLFKDFDWALFGAAMILSIIGLVEIYSATESTAGESYLLRQGARIAVGVLFLFVAATIDYRSMSEHIPWVYLLSLALLLVTLVIGKVVAGSKSWLAVAGSRFQPSELIKIVVVVAVARYLSDLRSSRYLSNPDILKAGMVCGLPILLVALQPDLGTALTYTPVLTFGLFVRGIKPKMLAGLVVMFLLALPAAWFVLKPYQKDRIMTFVNPERDPQGAGYHVLQSKIAIGSGGFWGKGIRHGSQNRGEFLPARHTDFILAVIGEELGFAGICVTLGLLAFIIYRSIATARTARDNLGVFIVMGVVGILFFHMIVNVGMVIGFMPITGIPLPFVSYGGSSVLMAFIALGLVLNVRRRRFVN